jgi:periplasmic divalent cation tolerance protein
VPFEPSRSEFVIVLTTWPAEGDADLLATTLVGEHLAACVNVLPPMRSTYAWKGSIESAEERQVVIKTRSALVSELEARLKTLHPYEVPEFLVVPLSGGSQPYLTWLSDNTQC